ncbi:ThiF family adenylyltransferase [Caballeronia sp. TF1N1]|uniref:ThiF family adenylyltransferase n=1 Tax=Caballeronia sp. TF1N1 TaxID=2878153 RepID=UPI001FD11FBA|nr:ThiF family adenylyltransferase [Caballeronia sp. TF1N1]
MWPDEWRKLRGREVAGLQAKLAGSFPIAGAWKLDMPLGEHLHPRVDHVILLIDDVFPFSQFRVCAPQAEGRLAERWPHVEGKGMLCLASQPLGLPIDERLKRAVTDAAMLFSMDEAARKAEFQREALSYWERESGDTKSWRSLFPPAGVSRAIFYANHRGAFVFADSETQLLSWFRHSNIGDAPKPMRAWFAMLDEALVPAQYPSTGSDLLRLIGCEQILPMLDPPRFFPVLLGMPTKTGAVFVAVQLQCPSKRDMWKGFRPGARLPDVRVLPAYSGRRVERVQVVRADHSWVHGRDHNPAAAILAEKTVALIGCGALGAEIARLLTQSGVGNLMLIDHDTLASENTSRHVLGSAETGGKKASGLAKKLKRDFPTIRQACSFDQRYEQLPEDQLVKIDAADLVITAGLFLPTDIRVNERRKRAAVKRPWLVAWAEELACAGHAALLVSDTDLTELFDIAGRPKLAMTSNWPSSVGTVTEAGCGTSFQPYSALDMLNTVALATRLALDSLMGRRAASTYRVWLGDRDRVARSGATLATTFDAGMTEREMPWPR